MRLFFGSAWSCARIISWSVLVVLPVTSARAAGSDVTQSGTAASNATLSYAAALPPAATVTLRKIDNDLLDDISRRSFRYFWEQTDATTGLVLDRALASGEPDNSSQKVASIAATGFGLTALCIAMDHRWIGHEAARERVVAALQYFAERAPQMHGWFYHFVDAHTGNRVWQSEVSTIDTALLLGGVLTVRQCFQSDPEIVSLATKIYSRVDFPWMMDSSQTYFSHGWAPERGFLPYRWDTYSELLILYILGIGSPSHPISPTTWDRWKLPLVEEGDYRFVGGGPLFIHQYSQAWLDLRDRSAPPSSDPLTSYRVNYFANSVAATRAHRELFEKLASEYQGYSENVWGVTASDSTKGYTNWGGSSDPAVDGT